MRKYLPLSLLFSSCLWADQTLLVDPYYSPFMGASDLLLGEYSLTRFEDYLNPHKSDTTIAIWGRTMEQVAWLCVNQVTSTTQHEIFGHGYRLRQLGYPPIHYTIGIGSGATYYDVPDSFLLGEALAVTVAGLEAESILARTAKMEWMTKGQIDGRLGMTYFSSQQSLFFYTLYTHLGRLSGTLSDPGNDVSSYLDLLHATYPYEDTSIGTLTFWSVWNWLDPMTFYSLASWFYTIATAQPLPFPRITLADDVYYLPNIKIGYAPYGPEAYLEHYFSLRGRPLYGYFKGGSKSFGFGLDYQYAWERSRFILGGRFDAWAQRQYLSSATLEDLYEDEDTQAPLGKIYGLAASLTARIGLLSHLQLFLELGGKTSGYLPGYSLFGGLVVRGGLTFNSF